MLPALTVVPAVEGYAEVFRYVQLNGAGVVQFCRIAKVEPGEPDPRD